MPLMATAEEDVLDAVLLRRPTSVAARGRQRHHDRRRDVKLALVQSVLLDPP